jgi:hypothetical protein
VLELLVLSLAVLWAWEFVLVLSPVSIPAIVQPPMVVGIAYGALHIPDKLLLAGAVAGAVALLHLVIRHLADAGPVLSQVIGRRSRIPDLP